MVTKEQLDKWINEKSKPEDLREMHEVHFQILDMLGKGTLGKEDVIIVTAVLTHLHTQTSLLMEMLVELREIKEKVDVVATK